MEIRRKGEGEGSKVPPTATTTGILQQLPQNPNPTSCLLASIFLFRRIRISYINTSTMPRSL
eukprot:992342-Rhodomonas_salina.1